MEKTLAGRVAIVTGANQGLGLEIAKQFAAAGASLVVCARDAERLEQAAFAIRERMAPPQRLCIHAADISRRSACETLVAQALEQFSGLDILVNNAGIYGPKGSIETVDWDEWVRAIEINLFGSVLMCRAVVPHFKRQGRGKIIQLSGGGATNPLPFISSYAASKAAIVRFAETLAEEVRAAGIDVNCIAPGALNTRLLDEVLAAGPEQVGQSFYERALKQKESGGAPLEVGARLATFLASSESDGITGKLISAVWDPWATFPAHFAELADTDVYTLRRIVPTDRGMDWGKA